jgi:nascent polypeptide-associated complex subunit alpha
MLPKISPRKMKRMMKQIGMEIEELKAEEVVIKLSDKEVVIQNPDVKVLSAKGQKIYQVLQNRRALEKKKREKPWRKQKAT